MGSRGICPWRTSKCKCGPGCIGARDGRQAAVSTRIVRETKRQDAKTAKVLDLGSLCHGGMALFHLCSGWFFADAVATHEVDVPAARVVGHVVAIAHPLD